MSITKLTSPLIVGGKQVYPLTSSDQIIMSDGTTLESAGGGIYSTIDEKISESFLTILDLVYPVGSIYMSVNNTSPAILFGGIWEQIKDTFLLSAGDSYAAGVTGGESEHTLTVDEMPSHNHSFVRQQWFTVDAVESSSTGSIFSWKSGTGGTTSASYTGQPTKSSGGSQPHNNMPPYLTVYCWKRVS